ncbi:MAG: glycoside hydrolase family 25 protein [Lachnospiraceae bacterium]|nr:glycoside hydrolase family 25 protein [Lachnospiraceae bacterium]
MNVRAKRILVIIIPLIIIAAIALIIINVNADKTYPTFTETSVDEREWTLVSGFEKTIIEGNYWSFARASYVLVGQYPDYEYYKIPSNVPRNDYETDSFFIEDDDFMYYHDDNAGKISHIAVDVSSYQENVDWDALKAAGVDTVLIRVGYRGYGTGAIAEDTMFESHVEGAKEAGLSIGIYFFSQAINYEEGVEEAQYAINAARKHGLSGPIIIDTEMIYADGARTENLSIEDRTDAVVGFCETVEGAGYEPLVYSNRNWFVQQLDMSRVGIYKLWLAQYANQPDFPYLYVGWQYTDEGYVPGVDIDLDLNVWFE